MLSPAQTVWATYPLSAHCGQGFVTLLPEINTMVFLYPPMTSPMNIALSIELMMLLGARRIPTAVVGIILQHSNHCHHFSRCTCPGQSIEQVSRQSTSLRFSLRNKEFRVRARTEDAILGRKVDMLVLAASHFGHRQNSRNSYRSA